MNSDSNNLITKLKKSAFSLSRQLNSISGIFLIILMLLASTDVIMRYLVRRPLRGTIAIIEVLLVIIGALSFSYKETTREHIRIDFISSRLPKDKEESLETFADLLNLTMLILVSIAVFIHARYMQTTGLVLLDVGIPTYPFVYIMSFGWAFFALIKFINLVTSIKEKGSRFWIGLFIGVLILLFLFLIKEPISNNLGSLQIGFLGAIALLIFTFSGMHLGMSLIIAAFFGIAYASGWPMALKVLRFGPYSTIAAYNYSVYPLFIYMGAIVFFSGIGENLFSTGNKWLGQFRGGLAMASIVASAGFAAVSGSGTANAATMSKIALPEMKKYNYDDRLTAGAIAAGGTIGPLIPPSTIFVLYGILTQQPIGKLFMAGIIPGLMKTVIYILVVYFLCRKNPNWGPRTPVKYSLREKIISLKDTWPIIVLFTIVMGGLYTGAFTPSEAAGIGAFGALLCAVIKGGFSLKKIIFASTDTTKTIGSLMTILPCAVTFCTFLTLTRIPFELADMIAGLTINRYLILTVLIIIYLILGSIMEIFAVVVVTVPIVFPVIVELGFDPIWFGVLVAVLFEVGALTPPIGINVFVVKSVVPSLSLETIFKGVAPFYIADMLSIFLLVAFPQIATFIPSLM